MLNINFRMDPLTELPKFFGLLDSDIKSICKDNGIIEAFDLTGLAAVNKQYGMKTGDIYIKCLSDSILYVIKQAGIAQDKAFPFRVGGDEFIIILHENGISV